MRYLAGRIDGLSSAILVFPLFAVYQLGILTGRGQNGVDFLTRTFIEMAAHDLTSYLATLAGMLVAYAAIVVLLRRTGTFDPRIFLPMLVECTFYALSMGSLIVFVLSRLAPFVPGLSLLSGPLEVIVVSAGAGFHEELVFRVVLLGGLTWLLAGVTGRRRALFLAVVVSSLLFSLAHHVGPAGEPFAFAAFVYRTFAGLFFAIVYLVRGFAVAAWTHALYDVYVLSVT
ncbi:MAG: CPBP family intramembrane metalloprotease [Deltaproteobacteria bacterium]|nr:MAG: CPBP family intramembrane metalloprotease [Deltaproteobacteria bacterium]